MTAYCCLLVAKYGCMHARTSPTTGAASFPRHYVELGLRARAAVDSQTSCFPHLVRKDAARLVPFRMSEQTNKRKKKQLPLSARTTWCLLLPTLIAGNVSR